MTQQPSASTEIILNKIEARIRHSGGRMTGVRREIAAIMATLKEPKTAYQILGAANKKRKTKLSAISVYRTLNFFIEAGIAIRFESKNAYRLCLNDRPAHNHLVMICDKCGQIREVEDPKLSKALAAAARKHGHALRHPIVELHGVCIKH